MRDHDWKYLRIAGNEFLFDVARDPRERANVKGVHEDVFERLSQAWESWNGTMLAERPRKHRDPGLRFPDRYQIPRPVDPSTP